MTRVLALVKYGDQAASTRQRLLQYRPFLGQAGIQIDAVPLLDNDHVRGLVTGSRADAGKVALSYLRRARDLATRRDFDVLWLHCETFPYLPAIAELATLWPRKPVIYDFDDAIFHQYDGHRNTLVRRALGRKLEPLLRRVSACACGNAYLHDYARRFCRKAMILPTVVDTDVYRPFASIAPHQHAVRLGWIGSPTTWRFVEPYLPVLSHVAAQYDAAIHVVGAGRQPVADPRVTFVDWSEATEVADIQNMDIGIMPLPDEPWARGKCGYKLIQYMACGLPVVASPVGVNTHIVVHGENGFLASTEAEWMGALSRLAADPGLRRRLGAAGRARVEAEFSLQGQAPRMLDLIQSVLT